MIQTKTPPSGAATFWFLLALIVTALTVGGETAERVAFHGAIGVTAGLGLAVGIEVWRGWRNIFRADILALCALHFLSMFEFLFPQPRLNEFLTAEETTTGVYLIIIGFVSLLIGRHITLPTSSHLKRLTHRPVPSDTLIRLFWICVAIGYFYMLYTVSFNPVRFFNEMFDPRFGRPWTRGKFGGWNALLYELNRLIYLVPPLAGVILARKERYSLKQVTAVISVLTFTLFYGFASGTRNVFGTYLMTSLVGYAFALPPRAYKKAGIALITGVGLMGAATRLMVAFREKGLGHYLATDPSGGGYMEGRTIFVDYNLRVIAGLAQKFPERYDFLGFEIPYNALVRPIPRALWPGKPEGLSVSIEQAMGVEGMTLATTFIGEAYMSGGVIAIILFGLFFGMFARWWNAYGGDRSSELGIVIYAAGIFTLAITMRSTLVFTESILSAIAAIIIGQYLLGRSQHPSAMFHWNPASGPPPSQRDMHYS